MCDMPARLHQLNYFSILSSALHEFTTIIFFSLHWSICEGWELGRQHQLCIACLCVVRHTHRIHSIIWTVASSGDHMYITWGGTGAVTDRILICLIAQVRFSFSGGQQQWNHYPGFRSCTGMRLELACNTNNRHAISVKELPWFLHPWLISCLSLEFLFVLHTDEQGKMEKSLYHVVL